MENKATIKHIEFWVSDLKRSMRFYKDLFSIIGWNGIEKNAFSNGQIKIYFIEQRVKSQKTIGPRHICFLASSRRIVGEVANLLIKNRADIIRGPLESRYKNRSSYTVDFRDPDGYIIEVATKSIALRK
jgi:catechol 2,3-dioxygenase-like lactoylglutathione lyase family enzyme